MIESVTLACGHSELYERPYTKKGPAAGDVYRCPRCNKITEVTLVKARSK